jgi:CelD/BcsL family acetyltransferase involved in cellulose biosynthesis
MSLEVYENLLVDSPGTRAWLAIDRSLDDLNPFLSLAWARAWLRSYEDIDESFLWRESDGSRETLLALMTRRGELRSLCYNAADYTGCVQTPGPTYEPKLLPDALLSQARRVPTILWNISTTDPLAVSLRRRFSFGEIQTTAMHFVDLEQVRADLPLWVKSSTCRRQAHRDFRRLQRDGAVAQFGVPPQHVDLDELISLHTDEWRSRNKAGNFADRRRQVFVRLLLTAGVPIYLSTLRLGGSLLAYRFSLTSSSRVYGWNSGFNIGYRSRGPGSALLVAELLHLASHSTMRTVDLLRGDEAYKRSYMSGTSWVQTLRLSGVVPHEPSNGI